MLRRALIILAALLAFFHAGAAPAIPTPVRHVQPDGSVVEVRIHGDEFYHYYTVDGHVAALGRDGFWHPARKPSFSKGALLKDRARTSRRISRAATRAGSRISLGEKHFLVLLVEFKDLSFSVADPAAAFSRMLNSEGYSENGGTGSVADYFKDNSNDRFTPVFDVVGPVRVSGAFADYGGNDADGADKNLTGFAAEAFRLADAQTDYSDYDLDSDGYIDNVYIFYAGHSEAEGASADHLWPQASAISGENLVLDGVRAWSFACSSELRGANGSIMSGIGTFCHEFAHVLGLPDFYDTDYEENGSADAVYSFSLMCSGNYNNAGRTPPYMGALERWMLGWTDAPVQMDAPGRKTLGPVYDDESAATPGSGAGEFFLYEVRDGSKWDAYIFARSGQTPPEGMLVYHVDMSSETVWDMNIINNSAAHPCYYLVKPVSSWGNYNDLLYPGTSGTTSFEGTDWAGNKTGFVLSGISYGASKASFTLSVPGEMVLSGTVTDSESKALQGVKVSGGGNSSTTGADGTYELAFPGAGEYEVSFSLDMFRPRTETAVLKTARTTLDVMLWNVAESEPLTLSKHGDDRGTALGYPDEADPHTGTIAVGFSASDLDGYQGYEIKSLRFKMHGSSAKKVCAFVDFGNERKVTREISSPVFDAWNTVDISDAGLTIPVGKTVYIGYAVQGIDEDFWMSIDGAAAVSGGGYVRKEYASQGSNAWYEPGYNFLVDCVVCKPVPVFAQLSLRTISNPLKGEPYAVGTELALGFDDDSLGDAPLSVEWLFDSLKVEGNSVRLSSAGRHVITARLSYPDGSVEEIEQVVLVQ